jgi:hypothetical protein
VNAVVSVMLRCGALVMDQGLIGETEGVCPTGTRLVLVAGNNLMQRVVGEGLSL